MWKNEQKWCEWILLFFQAIRIKPLTYQEQGLASFPCAPLNLLGRSGVGIILSHCEKRRQHGSISLMIEQ